MPQPAPERSTVAPESQALVPTVEPAKTNELEGPVLIAHPEVEEGRRVAEALAARGLETLVVNDGVEAILNIQRSLPRVVVLDAALPKMFGFQVCEIVKRNESLRGIHVVLVGAIHDQDRYRRPPRDLYGADAYVERQELPDALIPLLEGFGVALGPPVQPPALPLRKDPAPAPALPLQRDPSPAPSATEAVPTPVHREPTPLSAVPSAPTIGPPAAAPFTGAAATLDPVEPPTETSAAPQPAPVLPPPAAPDPAVAAEVEQAERLARIIVSDVVLYNPEKFEAGVRDGNVLQVLESELNEGRALFSQRVDPRVGSPGHFLESELLRVARSRGMK
jgi:CheY-like chemotaxis protein